MCTSKSYILLDITSIKKIVQQNKINFKNKNIKITFIIMYVFISVKNNGNQNVQIVYKSYSSLVRYL